MLLKKHWAALKDIAMILKLREREILVYAASLPSCNSKTDEVKLQKNYGLEERQEGLKLC